MILSKVPENEEVNDSVNTSESFNSTSQESSSSIIRWLLSFTLPIIFSLFLYLVSFKYIYNFFLAKLDPSFLIGYIISIPLIITLSLIIMYSLLPKYKFGITTIVCIIIVIINIFLTIQNIILGPEFNKARAIQNFISNILIFFVCIYFPVFINKSKNKK